MKSLRRVLGDLIGRSGEVVVDRLEEQLAVVQDAVKLLDQGVDGAVGVGDEIAELERQGDERRAEFTRFLSTCLTTPIDREDLFRLSRSIDDVLDNLRDYVRELQLYRPPDARPLLPVLERITDAIDALHRAVRSLTERPTAVVAAARDAEHAAAQVRRQFEQSLGGLFEHGMDEDALRTREVLRRLDVVGLRIGEACHALADGALKRT